MSPFYAILTLQKFGKCDTGEKHAINCTKYQRKDFRGERKRRNSHSAIRVNRVGLEARTYSVAKSLSCNTCRLWCSIMSSL